MPQLCLCECLCTLNTGVGMEKDCICSASSPASCTFSIKWQNLHMLLTACVPTSVGNKEPCIFRALGCRGYAMYTMCNQSAYVGSLLILCWMHTCRLGIEPEGKVLFPICTHLLFMSTMPTSLISDIASCTGIALVNET